VTSRNRRRFLRQAAGAAGGLLMRQAPAIVTAEAARPEIPSGTSAGDVTAGRATLWSRTDRPARMVVEYATTDSFADTRRVVGPAALEDTGFTARVELSGLPAGQRIAYRVLFQDLSNLKAWSLPSAGSFRTPPTRASDVLLAWSADTAGQGWGINPDWGGMRLYETMRRASPDVFIHVGDTIYADQPIRPEVALDDGTVWRNLVTPAKSKVAETLEDFRGNHLYNLMDENVRRFNAEVAQIVMWDDHEVHDNWYPTEVLDTDSRYAVKSVALLAGRAKRAFFEHHPIRLDPEDAERVYRAYAYGPAVEVFALDMRTYRGPNSPNRQDSLGPDSAILGAAQVEWLAQRLAASPATWKVIASDMPLGLVVRDGPSDFEAVANGDGGPARGRELEIARLLGLLKQRRVRNVVWVTGDVHYCAAHHYDPARARFTQFDPFWEFVAGPLHAGTFGPGELDATFGPEARFVGIPPGMKPNRPPSAGFQFFGTLKIDGRRRVLTARLHDLSGKAIFSVELPPQG
jgi:alkaline phosphatase D